MAEFSHEAYIVKEAICAEAAIVRQALTAPHVLMKPAVFPDGDQWCALYGKDLMAGVAGFGPSPADAMADFDKNWSSQRLSPDGLAGR